MLTARFVRRDTLEQKLPDLKPRDIDEILKANADAVEMQVNSAFSEQID